MSLQYAHKVGAVCAVLVSCWGWRRPEENRKWKIQNKNAEENIFVYTKQGLRMSRVKWTERNSKHFRFLLAFISCDRHTRLTFFCSSISLVGVKVAGGRSLKVEISTRLEHSFGETQQWAIKCRKIVQVSAEWVKWHMQSAFLITSGNCGCGWKKRKNSRACRERIRAHEWHQSEFLITENGRKHWRDEA